MMDEHDRNELRESLAEYAHEAWAGWMEYLFRHGTQNRDGTFTMDAEKVERWRRQMDTPYTALSDAEKDSDRVEADRMLGIAGAMCTPLHVQIDGLKLAATQYSESRDHWFLEVKRLQADLVQARAVVDAARAVEGADDLDSDVGEFERALSRLYAALAALEAKP